MNKCIDAIHSTYNHQELVFAQILLFIEINCRQRLKTLFWFLLLFLIMSRDGFLYIITTKSVTRRLENSLKYRNVFCRSILMKSQNGLGRERFVFDFAGHFTLFLHRHRHYTYSILTEYRCKLNMSKT